MTEPVVRISQGFFEPEQFNDVEAKLRDGKASLDSALRALDGLLHYYVAIDKSTGSMINVSVWKNLESAMQMDTLAAMLAQREVFIALGVKFQPIRNYHGLWSIMA